MDDFLTYDEVAKLLKVSKAWVYSRKGQGKIPFITVGKSTRFVKEDIIKWAKSGNAAD